MAFGDQIQAGLMRPDYSGIIQAGQATGMGYAALGQGISNALEGFGEMKKQRNEMEKTVKQSELYIDAAMKLFPAMAPSLAQAKEQIYDVNAPLKDRFAVAESVQGLLNLSMQKMQMDSQELDALRASQVKMAELMSKPPEVMETYDSSGRKLQKYYDPQSQSFRPISERISGSIPELPTDMQTEIDSSMPPVDGDVLPGRPIEGQIEQLLGMTPEGKIQLVAGGQEIETDANTFSQKIIGDLMQGGESPENAAATASQILAGLEMNRQKEQPIVGVSMPEQPKRAPVEMTQEQIDALAAQGTRVTGTPTGRGTVLVTEQTTSPESKRQEYTEPYTDPTTGQLVQRRSDGKLTVLKETSDERTLSVIQKAREAYNSGDTTTALDLLASVRIKGAFGGYPTVDDLETYFGAIQPQEVAPSTQPAPTSNPLADKLRKALNP